MILSILIVSRTPLYLNNTLKSLAQASTLDLDKVEILCSWNGELEDEKDIENLSEYEFRIAQRDHYHFAKNINNLARKANGEFLLIINDDVILDNESIDKAIECLLKEPKAGLVGGRLRDKSFNLITHSGIVFDDRDSPYHQFDRLFPADDPVVMGSNKIMPAVTGALMLIRRKDFLNVLFDEDFKVCGEDVQLCLGVRKELGLEVFYCPAFSGIHEGESTRKGQRNQVGNSEDLSKLQLLYREFINNSSQEELINDFICKRREAGVLRSFLDKSILNLSSSKKEANLLELKNLKKVKKLKKLIKKLKKLKKVKKVENLKKLKKIIKKLKPYKNKILPLESQIHSLQLQRISKEAEITNFKRELQRFKSIELNNN